MTGSWGDRSKRRRDHPEEAVQGPDLGISSIVAEILLVALALAIAAGAWLFFSGFGNLADPNDVPEDAVRATTFDPDDDGNAEWIKLTLVRANRDAFSSDDVSLTVVPHGDGANHQASASTPILCNSPQATSGTSPLTAACSSDSENFMHASSSQTSWGPSQALYVPCQDGSDHSLTVTLDGTLVLEVTKACGEAAA